MEQEILLMYKGLHCQHVASAPQPSWWQGHLSLQSVLFSVQLGSELLSVQQH